MGSGGERQVSPSFQVIGSWLVKNTRLHEGLEPPTPSYSGSVFFPNSSLPWSLEACLSPLHCRSKDPRYRDDSGSRTTSASTYNISGAVVDVDVTVRNQIPGEAG